MSCRVLLTPDAEEHLRAADRWWQENRSASPDLLLDEFEQTVRLVQEMPGLGGREACSRQRRSPLRRRRGLPQPLPAPAASRLRPGPERPLLPQLLGDPLVWNRSSSFSIRAALFDLPNHVDVVQNVFQSTVVWQSIEESADFLLCLHSTQCTRSKSEAHETLSRAVSHSFPCTDFRHLTPRPCQTKRPGGNHEEIHSGNLSDVILQEDFPRLRWRSSFSLYVFGDGRSRNLVPEKSELSLYPRRAQARSQLLVEKLKEQRAERNKTRAEKAPEAARGAVSYWALRTARTRLALDLSALKTKPSLKLMRHASTSSFARVVDVQ